MDREFTCKLPWSNSLVTSSKSKREFIIMIELLYFMIAVFYFLFMRVWVQDNIISCVRLFTRKIGLILLAFGWIDICVDKRMFSVGYVFPIDVVPANLSFFVCVDNSNECIILFLLKEIISWVDHMNRCTHLFTGGCRRPCHHLLWWRRGEVDDVIILAYCKETS